MTVRPEPGLRRTLMQWLLGPLLLLLVLDTGVSWWTSQRAADLAHDRSLHEIAREVALYVRPDGPHGAWALSAAAQDILLGDPEDRVFFKVTSDKGQVLGGDATLAAPAQGVIQGARRVTFYHDRLHGEPVRVVAAWIPLGSAAGGAAVLVQVAETLNQRNALAWEILAHALVPQLLLIALATGAVWFGVRNGLWPLERLRHALARRSHLDLAPIDKRGVPHEVQPLVGEINELMGRLEQALDLRNRFIADAAHQLKTPVSGLKAQIELALRESDPHRLQHAMAQLYVGVDRLSRLVRQLLSLARNEPGAVDSLRLQPLDLSALALDVSMEWAPQALRRQIDLGFEGGQTPLMIRADADRLRELLNNLIDNAVRYSQEGGRITVAAQATSDGQVRLAVSDDGPHIPPEERTRIFERFHRLLGTQADGSGLGLAIVSEIATLHGARITLTEDDDGVGNTFSVLFPAL